MNKVNESRLVVQTNQWKSQLVFTFHDLLSALSRGLKAYWLSVHSDISI